jgi:hypothetical protein|tara:strand:- start:1814 stop:2218 length:405 start_codon:yes stop_codon:yes gene_type:complete
MATENNTTFVAADNSSLLGKELEFITIDAGEELANHQAKNETQNAIENTVRVYGNIVGAGPLFDTNASRTYIVEGTDMFVGDPASSGGTFTFTESGADGSSVGTLVAALKALGTVDGIDLNDSGTTAKIENLEL